MEQTDDRLWSLLRAPEGPLVPYIDAFARQLNEHGFKRYSIAPQIRLVAKFSRWLKANHIGVERVTEEHVQRFLRRLKPRRSSQLGFDAALHRLIVFLQQLDVIDEQAPLAEATPIQMVVGAFAQHLRQDRALSHATFVQYVPFIEQFLAERFGNGVIDLPTCAPPMSSDLSGDRPSG
ncbi:MAG: hypothetical protein IPI02_05390 [Sterolibacteriaceae bacterium]|nr:hypothetical protein [Sterolibacteriaceae bacterium]